MRPKTATRRESRTKTPRAKGTHAVAGFELVRVDAQLEALLVLRGYQANFPEGEKGGGREGGGSGDQEQSGGQVERAAEELDFANEKRLHGKSWKGNLKIAK